MTENQIVSHFAEDPDPDRNVSNDLGEDYIAYYTALFEACRHMATQGQAEAVKAMANGVFDSGTPSADLMVKHASLALSEFISQAQTKSATRRARSAELLGRFVNENRLSDEAQLESAKATVKSLTQDPDPLVREVAVDVSKNWNSWNAIWYVVAALALLMIFLVALQGTKRVKHRS